MSETRNRIAEQVRTDPGIHFNELTRVLDLAPGQVQYHLRRLEDVIVDERFGRTHYYPPEFDEWERRALALLRRETAADVVGVLLADGPTPATDVAERVGIARSTLAWQVDRLREAGIVEKRRDAHDEVRLVLAAPERTADLLAKAQPSMPNRMVDRFTRLVDALLEG